MNKSEHKICNNNKNLIVCFGGMALKFGEILPFEFLNYLSTHYRHTCDLVFYIDKSQCWYHKGILGITDNIKDTVLYLNAVVNDGKYDTVIFMGVSAGGYASILFGSLCDRVNTVIGFIPQTVLTSPIDISYSNLKSILNSHTEYILYGDMSIIRPDDNHHISHCINIECFSNVTIIKEDRCILRELRDNGTIKELIDNALLKYS